MNRNRHDLQRDVIPVSQLSLFPSELGWFGLVGAEGRVIALTFGHHAPGEVHSRLLSDGTIERQATPVDWWPDLRARLQAYAVGVHDDFADVPVDRPSATGFQRAVIQALRHVGYGETVSYGELAQRAGSPHAARAVGRVMATNPVPIIVPCHRVIASGGRLGGFSAPSGLAMKERLLELEGAAQRIRGRFELLAAG